MDKTVLSLDQLIVDSFTPAGTIQDSHVAIVETGCVPNCGS